MRGGCVAERVHAVTGLSPTLTGDDVALPVQCRHRAARPNTISALQVLYIRSAVGTYFASFRCEIASDDTFGRFKLSGADRQASML